MVSAPTPRHPSCGCHTRNSAPPRVRQLLHERPHLRLLTSILAGLNAYSKRIGTGAPLASASLHKRCSEPIRGEAMTPAAVLFCGGSQTASRNVSLVLFPAFDVSAKAQRAPGAGQGRVGRQGRQLGDNLGAELGGQLDAELPPERDGAQDTPRGRRQPPPMSGPAPGLDRPGMAWHGMAWLSWCGRPGYEARPWSASGPGRRPGTQSGSPGPRC